MHWRIQKCVNRTEKATNSTLRTEKFSNLEESQMRKEQK